MNLPSLPSLPSAPTFPAISNLPQVTIPSIDTGAFTSGPSDAVATADIYKLKSAMGGASPITSIQELNLTNDSSLFSSDLAPGGASDFLSKLEGGNLGFDKDLLTGRILGTNSDFKSTFNELNDAMKKGALLSTYKDKASGLMTTINGVSSMVNSAKISDVRSLGNFINKYTNSKIFSGKDSGAISGLLGSVITTSSNLGISGAFKAIADTVNDTGIVGRVTRGLLPVVLKNSDPKLLRDISSSSAGKLINVFSPGFTQNFTKAFTYRGNRGTQLNTFEDVFHSMENIDSQWNVLQRGSGSTALNLLAIVGGSKDFQNLLMTGVKHWATEKARGNSTPVPIDPLYALASAFSETTIDQAIARDFPHVALLSRYNARLPRKNGLPAGMKSAQQKATDARLLVGSVASLLGL